MRRGLRGDWCIFYVPQRKEYHIHWEVTVFGKPTWTRRWVFAEELVTALRRGKLWKKLLLCYRSCKKELEEEVFEAVHGREER